MSRSHREGKAPAILDKPVIDAIKQRRGCLSNPPARSHLQRLAWRAAGGPTTPEDRPHGRLRDDKPARIMREEPDPLIR
jgi:hypothetical protein